jgi:hypothetical protein
MAERAAQSLDLLEVVVRGRLECVGESFHVVAACQWIRRLRHAGLVCEDLLGPESETRSFGGWQRQGFVARIGVKALGSAKDRGQRLHSGPDYVVIDRLSGQRRTRSLNVESAGHGARV